MKNKFKLENKNNFYRSIKLYTIVKRFGDLFLCILFFPMLFVSIIFVFLYYLKNGEKGIFYTSYRIGKNGEPFKMYKFRTMMKNAPDIRLEDGSTFNSKDDFRIIKGGSFLRNSSIDELPQMINVLLGDMSFIGPRPDPTDWIDRYKEDEKFFLSVKPGITGYNQAYYRNNADAKLKIKNDIYYARNISFIFDLKIFFKTIKTIILKENLHVDRK